jgi:hypothetical protein
VTQEHPPDGLPDGQRVLQGLLPRELPCAEQGRNLDQRERVARRRAGKVRGNRRRDRLLSGGEQPNRVVLAQTGQAQVGQPGECEDGRFGVAQSDQQHDAFGAESPSGEPQRFDRGAVHPLHVVDDRQHRGVLGRHGEQAERRGRHREPVSRHWRADRQRASEGGRLGAWQAVEMVEQRPEQIGQAGERQLGLGLDPLGPEQPHAGGPLHGVAEQRGLADAGLPANHQRAALAVPCRLKEVVDPGAFPTPPHEHGPILSARLIVE